MDRAVYARMAEIDQDHWWFVARRRIVSALIQQHRPTEKPLRILEIGCGTGSNIAMLQTFGSVDAVEPDDGARELAAQRSGVAVRGGYLPEGVELADGHYDLIVLLDVLEHIPEDLPALVALRAKLAPGGRLLVTVPAMPWLWSAHDVAHHHQRRYTARSLSDVFAKAGFRLRHRTYFNSILFPLIVLARAANKIAGREGGDDAMPPRPVNAMLERLFGAERYWVTRRSLPFGVSLAAVAEPITR
jgi:SAM-dependent methyltransferase